MINGGAKKKQIQRKAQHAPRRLDYVIPIGQHVMTTDYKRLACIVLDQIQAKLMHQANQILTLIKIAPKRICVSNRLDPLAN